MIIAELDLENAEHRELTNSEWRYGDGLVPGEPNGGLVNLMKESPARLADYDDSGWPTCEDIQAIISETPSTSSGSVTVIRYQPKQSPSEMIA